LIAPRRYFARMSLSLFEGAPNGWFDAHPMFFQNYARARDKGFDVLALDDVDQANDPNIAPEDVERAKLGFDPNRWYLSKVAHRRYDDRLDVRQEVTGPNGGPLQIDVLHNLSLRPAVVERLSDTRLAALRSAIPLLAALVLEGVLAEAVTSVAPVAGLDAVGALSEDRRGGRRLTRSTGAYGGLSQMGGSSRL
jgi:hypothetical protein